MSIASVGDLGTASSKTTGTTLSMSPARSVAVDQLIAIWAMWDTGSTLHPNPSDSKGNIYTMAGWGSHGDIGLVAIYLCKVQVALATLDTITLTGSSLDAKAMSAWEFSFTSSEMRWAKNRKWSDGDGSSLGGDPPAVTFGVMDSQEYLLLHALGAEAPSTDTYTWDADYTQITPAGTTGGVDDSNVTILGGWRIATLTDDTIDVTSDTADRDYVQVYIAISEHDPINEFPTTGILDDFNRADEEPLDAGEWDTTLGAGSGSRKLRVVLNQSANGTTGTGFGGQWRIDELVSAEAEGYCTLASAPNGGSEGVGVIIMGGGASSSANKSGISAFYQEFTSGAFPGFDNVRYDIEGFTGPSPVAVCAVTLADGDKLGIEVRDKLSNLWLDLGSGWNWYGAIYRNTFASGGKIGLEIQGTDPRVDDFGGGDIFSLPQIIRRVLG